jgi:hypothetical protein
MYGRRMRLDMAQRAGSGIRRRLAAPEVMLESDSNYDRNSRLAGGLSSAMLWL